KFEFGLSPAIHKKIMDGEAADMIVIQPEYVAELIKAGKVSAGEYPVIAKVGVGIMVRAGAPVPKIATADALKQALLKADTVAYSTIGSGLVFAKAIERLGIVDQIKDKVFRGIPPDVSKRIAEGQGNDLGAGTMTLIAADQRLKLVGPLP